MCNNWFSFGGLTVHGYGVMIAVGVLLACWLGEKRAAAHGLKQDVITNLVILSVVIGFMGSKLLYVIVEWKQFLIDPWSVLGSGGFVLYGGIAAGIAAAQVFCRKHQMVFLDYFNLLAPEIALAQGFGRIGCFLAGCCYGKATNLFFGVTFPAGSLAPAGVPLIPTQLFSSLGDFLIFWLLSHFYEHGRHPEETGAWYLILYSIGRFVIEIFRGDERGSVGILSTSQFLAIPVLLIGCWLLYHCRQKQAGMIK